MAPVATQRATPEALETFLKAEISKWGRIIKSAGIEPQ
jgi:tripartite-type tricarboxylate transporter receptor subunit TctC